MPKFRPAKIPPTPPPPAYLDKISVGLEADDIYFAIACTGLALYALGWTLHLIYGRDEY